MSDKILLFTDSYPFTQDEPFLFGEIQELSKSFKEIIIQPTIWTDVMLPVPANVRVLPGILRNKSYRSILKKGLLNKSSPGAFWKVFSRNLISNLGQYFIARGLYNSSFDLRDLLQDSKVIKYFYWGKGAANLCVFYPVEGRTVVRLHGFDLYGPEVRTGNVIPLREALIKKVDDFVFISEHGRKYFEEKYHTQGRLYRLGSKFAGTSVSKSVNAPFTIVSCSSMIPLKRVQHIARVMSKVSEPILWVHIGDGQERESIEATIKSMPENVKVQLLGYLQHEEVLAFYRNNHVDAFISLSETEGLPFSMMEALSFSIPIIGTDVGGVSEIVTAETGFLFPRDFDEDKVTEAIEKLIRMPVTESQALRESSLRTYWNKFNAERNDRSFIEFLKS